MADIYKELFPLQLSEDEFLAYESKFYAVVRTLETNLRTVKWYGESNLKFRVHSDLAELKALTESLRYRFEAIKNER
jgi:hypothetical protein